MFVTVALLHLAGQAGPASSQERIDAADRAVGYAAALVAGLATLFAPSKLQEIRDYWESQLELFINEGDISGEE